MPAEHARPGRSPLGVLVLHRVRRVVGGDTVDDALGQRGPQLLGNTKGAQANAVASKRIRLQDLSAGLDVFLVDLFDQPGG